MSGPTHQAPVSPITPVPLGVAQTGLQFLRDQVAKYFLDESIPAVVAKVGLKYRSFQLNVSPDATANRICFIPGDFDGTNSTKARKYGELSRETRNATSVVNPRELAQWERTCTISVWAAPDPSALQEEDLSLINAEILLEQVIRGLYSAADITPDTPVTSFSVSGAFSMGEVFVNAPPVESGYGVELLVHILLRGPFFDKALEVVFPRPRITETLSGSAPT